MNKLLGPFLIVLGILLFYVKAYFSSLYGAEDLREGLRWYETTYILIAFVAVLLIFTGIFCIGAYFEEKHKNDDDDEEDDDE